MELIHLNVADNDFAGVSQGWEKYYWTSLAGNLDIGGSKWQGMPAVGAKNDRQK